jgi:hypothetical protein
METYIRRIYLIDAGKMPYCPAQTANNPKRIHQRRKNKRSRKVYYLGNTVVKLFPIVLVLTIIADLLYDILAQPEE